MKLKHGQRVVREDLHGTVLKRSKSGPAICYVRFDAGNIEAVRERDLRPEPVIIDLTVPLYGASSRSRRKKSGLASVKTSRTSASAEAARVVSGGRTESKR